MNRQEQIDLAAKIREIGVNTTWSIDALLAHLTAPEVLTAPDAVMELNDMSETISCGNSIDGASDEFPLTTSETLLAALNDARVFSVTRIGEMFSFTERYDNYYYAKLTREQVRTLAKELLALADTH